MEEDMTILQLTNLLSGIIRRINAKPLDKASDMRFIKLRPEQRADNLSEADRRTETRTENSLCKAQSPLINSPASRLRS